MPATPRMTVTSPSRIMSHKVTQGVFLFWVGALLTLAVVALIEQNTHFNSDDFSTFYLARKRSLIEHAFMPIGVHVVPLQRASSYLIYKLFPLNFRVALFVLLSFHVGTLLYLYRTLEALKATQLNQVLLFVYAANVYFFAALGWWSSGILRFPYIFFAVGSMYHYLQFRKSSAPRQLLAVALFFLLGLGFYAKGFLIPAYLLGLEVCLLRGTPRPQLLRNLYILSALALASVLLYQSGQTLVSAEHTGLNLDWDHLKDFEKLSLSVFSQGLLTFVYVGHRTVTDYVVRSVWTLFFLYTVIKRPRNLLVWCVGLGLVTLNILVVGISPRGSRLGLLVFTHRYYFELTFLAVVFLGLILQDLPRPRLTDLLTKPTVRRAVSALGAIVILGYALFSYSHAKELLERDYAKGSQVKEYVDNLKTSIEELNLDPSEGLALVDGRVPRYILGVRWGELGAYSRFLEIFDIRVSPPKQNAPLYRITDHGKIERVESVQVTPP
jgi:hypothetical protein